MDILAVLERINGTKWTAKHVTSEELISQNNRRLSEGDEMGAIDDTIDSLIELIN